LAGTEPGLVGYWRMDDGGGQVMNDYSPTNNDGQLGALATPDGQDPVFAAACPLSSCPPVSAVISTTGSTYICAGTTITLSAGSVAGMTYQWQFNSVNIPGATASTYAASQAGSYTCRVT